MSGSKYFLDTNIFLRIIAKDDQAKLAVCEKLIDKISQKKIKASTSSLVLAEVVWTCGKGYKLTRMEVTEVAKSILSIKNLKFEEKVNPAAAVEMFSDNNIKFADCLIASNSQISDGRMAVVSYDKDFDKLGIKRVEPSEIV